MAEGPEANCFILLKLDPGVEDITAIEKALQEGRDRWNKSINQGTTSDVRTAKQNIDRLPDIRKLMLDPETRREEAQQARRWLKEEGRKRREELTNSVKLLMIKGSCTQEDVDRLVKRLADQIPKKEILAALRAAGLTIEAPADSPQTSKISAKPRLDTDRMVNIRSVLKFVGFSDLYEFLGMPVKSSETSLWQEASKTSKKLDSGKTNADTDARKVLCGYCLDLFGSDEKRKKYDNALGFEKMEGLRPNIELAGRGGFLSIDVQNELVRQAVQQKVKEEDARLFIEEFAKKRQPPWHLAAVDLKPPPEIVQCGHCWTVQEPSANGGCKNCGKALQVACPRCDTKVTTDRDVCPKCAFHTGDWISIESRLDKAEKANRAGELDKAVSILSDIDRDWPGWKAVRARLEAVQGRLKQRGDGQEKVQALARKCRLIEAKSALEAFRRDWGEAGTAGLAKTIEDGIAHARTKTEEGERLRRMAKPEQAVACYQAALSFCVDYPQALQSLAAIPPKPPTALIVTPSRQGFSLRWLGDPAADSYRVVRKNGVAPAHQTDGSWHATTREMVIDDSEVPEGLVVHYAVFSDRKGVVSSSPARSGAQLRVGPVRQLKAQSGDRQVVLTWRLPTGASGVEIWRQAGAAPDRAGVGTRLAANGEQLSDLGLPNDVAQGYLVVAVFPDPQRPSGTLRGTAIAASATPTSVPEPVTDLRAVGDDGDVRLTWTPVAGNVAVQIRLLATKPIWLPRQVVTIGQVEELGTPVLATGVGAAQVKLSSVGEAWFLPVTIKGTLAVVGRATSMSLVRPVTGLAADGNGKNIFLTWQWPAGAQRAVVAFRHDAYPAGPLDSLAFRNEITLEQFKREGMFNLRRTEKRSHYFAVFAVTPDGRLYSAAQTVLVPGELREVRYRIVRSSGLLSRLLGRSDKPQLEVDGTGHLPELVLVSKKRVVPTGPDDGEKIMDISELELSGALRLALPDSAAGQGAFAKLFFKNPRYASEIKLIAGKVSELQL